MNGFISVILHQKARGEKVEKPSVSNELATRRKSNSRSLLVTWGAVLCLNLITEDKDMEERGIG